MTVDITEIAKRFVGSYTLEDVDPNLAELFAPSMTVWHNYDAERMQLPGATYVQAMMLKLTACKKRIPDYTDIIDHLHISDSAITVAATASGTFPDGTALHIPRCLVISVENGLIVSIDSYGDHSQSGPLDRFIPYEELFASTEAS